MRTSSVLLVALMPILVASCMKPAGHEYYPLPEKGTSRTYTATYGSPSGEVSKIQVVRRGEGSETVDGHRYWKEVEVVSGIPGVDAPVHYYRRGDDGIYKIHGNDRDSGEYLVFPLPLEIGKSWTVVEPSGTTLTYTAEAIESVALPSRTIERCLKLTVSGQSDSEQITGTVFHAPGVGEVRSVYDASGVTVEVILESSS